MKISVLCVCPGKKKKSPGARQIRLRDSKSKKRSHSKSIAKIRSRA